MNKIGRKKRLPGRAWSGLLLSLIALPALGVDPAPDAERPVRLCIDPAWAPFEYIAVRRDRPAWLPFSEAMAGSITDEDRREVENRWLAAWVESPPDLRWLWVALVVLALSALIAGIFIWRHTLVCRQARVLEQLNQALSEARDRAERSEARYAELAEQSRSYAWDVDCDGCYTDVSASVKTVLGYTPDELLGRPFWEIAPADEQVEMRAIGLSTIHEGESLSGLENRVLTREGRALWVSTSGVPIQDEDGALIGFRGIDIDVDERRRQRDLLHYYAFYDVLTQVPNRRMFLEALDGAIARFRRHTRHFAILTFDLDHFKRVNDTHGHAAGDALLCQFASQAQAALRCGDLLARLGGEEFAALLFESSAAGAEQMAERIRAGVAAAPLVFESREIALTVSIGGTCVRDEDTPESLLARADDALYEAKRNGRNCVVLRAAA